MIADLSIGLATARWLTYLAVFIVMGATLLRYQVIPRLEQPIQEQLVRFAQGVVLYARLAVMILAVTTILRFYLQLRSLVDVDEPLTMELARTVAASPWGQGWLIQAGMTFF